jgi:hypothetical protein
VFLKVYFRGLFFDGLCQYFYILLLDMHNLEGHGFVFSIVTGLFDFCEFCGYAFIYHVREHS